MVQTYIFKLPDIGEGTAEAEVATWRVAVGDVVVEDQALVDIMTDKATVEITSPVAGVVAALHAEVGEMAPVGGPLITFSMEASRARSPATLPAATQQPVGDPQSVAAAVVGQAVGMSSTAGALDAKSAPSQSNQQSAQWVERPVAAPAVRRRARELGVSLKLVRGSGPRGRILQEDLDAYRSGVTPTQVAVTPKQPSAEPFEEIRIIGLRRKIAEKMQLSKRTIPHFSYIEEVDVTELESLREHLNATRSVNDPKLSPLPFLIRAVVRALPGFPQANAHYDEASGVVRRFRAVHVGIATQTPGGLMVPVVRNAEALDIRAAAREIARLAEAARKGKATLSELSGSTITLTSLGTLGGLAATPVINAPEVAIIGPNRIIERPVFVGQRVEARKMMNVSASFDHRIVDGYDAAAFIQQIKQYLEHPALLFAGREKW